MNPREPRLYPYDGQHAAWSSGQVAVHDIEFMTNGYTYDSSNQYYPSSSHDFNPVNDMASTSGSYFRSITPSLVSGHRYPHPNRDLRYSPTQGFVSQPSSLAQALYTPQSQQYAAHGLPMAPAEENMPLPDHTTQPTRFIPTPSQIAHAYSTYPQQMASSALQAELYDPSSLDYTGTSPMVSTNNLHRRHSRTLSVRPRGGSVANSVSSASTAASPSGERFPCEKCGKTFSRSHDRKRHYETQHLPSPIVHRCVYCHKEFSRADSLKRHLDNGCDEMRT